MKMNKKNNLTELVFILDRSGSMSGLESDTIGANIDAIETIETAARFGIERNCAVNYNADSKGIQILYETLSAAICAMRADASIPNDWSQDIEEDYHNRK